MKTVTMYVTPSCGYCHSAKSLLARKGVAQIELLDITRSHAVMEQMMERTGRRTVPQVYIGDAHVGGFDDLAALDKAGELDRMLKD